jgi:hypothetical protein
MIAAAAAPANAKNAIPHANVPASTVGLPDGFFMPLPTTNPQAASIGTLSLTRQARFKTALIQRSRELSELASEVADRARPKTK